MKQDQFQETGSTKAHLSGFIEKSLRKIKPLSMLLVFLLVAGICAFCIGSAAGFAMWIYDLMLGASSSYWLKGLSFAAAFVSYSLSLMVIVALVNRLFFLPKLVKPFRGNAFSLESVPWYLHNGLLYIVRYSCLEYFTPSPITVLFYRAMGMKIGKGTIINTTNISDACLITLGDYVTIGGSAYLLAHYSQDGYLILATVTIGNKSTIGLKATVFGNVVIGEKCTVRPHIVVLPKTVMLDGDKV